VSGDLTAAFERVTGDLRDDPNLIATLEVVDTLNVMVEGGHPILRCPDGCARCCFQQIFISEEEWAIVLRALHRDSTVDERRRIVRRARRLLDRKRGPLRRALRARNLDDLRRLTLNVDRRRVQRCVLLTGDNLCAGYSGRPMVCRAFGRVSHSLDNPMLCKIFLDRLQDSGTSHRDLQLPDFGPIRSAYLLGAAEELGFTLLPIFVVLHQDADGDLLPEPQPLPRDGSWPVLSREEIAQL
jgi:Fe-S-cluster containining protein